MTDSVKDAYEKWDKSTKAYREATQTVGGAYLELLEASDRHEDALNRRATARNVMHSNHYALTKARLESETVDPS